MRYYDVVDMDESQLPTIWEALAIGCKGPTFWKGEYLLYKEIRSWVYLVTIKEKSQTKSYIRRGEDFIHYTTFRKHGSSRL